MKKRFLFPIIFAVFFPVLASAVIKIENPLGPTDTPGKLLALIVNGVGEVVAGLGIVGLLVAAIFFVTAGGSEEQYTKAKKALLYAVIGLAIGLGASTLSYIIKQIIGVQ